MAEVPVKDKIEHIVALVSDFAKKTFAFHHTGIQLP